MASFKQYTASGGSTEAFSIPSFTSDEIKVRVDGVLKTAATHYNITSYTTNGGTVTWTSGNVPSSGTVYIYRDTKILNSGNSDVEGKATYSNSSPIYHGDLNNNQTQVLRALEEKDDQLIQSWDLASSSVETSSIKDGTIVNADINASANIAGSKLADDSVALAKLGSGALPTDIIVATTNIVDGTILDADINANANIQGSKLLNDSIGLTKLGSGALPTDITVASANIVNGAIVDADISGTAEIAVSKLADGSARQILQTASNGSDVEWTSNVDVPGTLEVTGAVDFDNNLNVDGTLTVDGVSTLTGNVTVGGTVDGRDVAADGSKLDGIDVGAKDDQTAAEIRVLVEAASDSNVFTDADHTKVNAAATLTGSETLTNKTLTSPVINDMSGTAVVTSGTSTSDTKTYSAKRAGEIFYGKDTVEEIQSGETWSAADNKIATTSAIDARIIDLVDDVGGFVPIANETSFPSANPDVNNGAGTLVSIKALASNLTSNGSGVATIANGAGSGNTVTINGLANSTTYAATFGMIVETTSTLHTYSFHRQVPKATEVTTVAGSITNVNTVAGSVSNVNTVAGSISNVNAVAADAADIGAVAGKATEIGRLGTADAVSDLNTLGTTAIVSDLDTLADISSNITTVAGISGNVTTVAGISANVTTVAGVQANVTTVAGSISNVNTVASNISTVNDFAARYRVSGSAPTSSLDAGDLYFDTTGSELKVYNGSAWQGGVTATGNLVSKAGDQMTGNLTFTGSQTVDGRDLSVDGAKLDGIETAATADQTDAEIRTAVENASDSNVFTDADHTKLNGIATSANNYTHPNHTGEVTSTADGATVIADDTVDEANLKISNSGSNGQFLSKQSGNTGGLTWATPTDTTYSAGTGISISGTTISASAVALTTVQTAANQSAQLSLTAQEGDVVVRTDENKSYVHNGGSAGSMADYTLLATPTDAVLSVNGNTGAITAAQIATAVEAASDSNTFTDADHSKLNGIETAATADQTASEIVALVADQTIAPSEIDMEDNEKIKLGTGDDLQLYHDGTHSIIKNTNNSGYLEIDTDNFRILDSGGSEWMIKGVKDGAVELFYDNVKKFETTSTGTNVIGVHVDDGATHDGDVSLNGASYNAWWDKSDNAFKFDDNTKIKVGTGGDLEIFHDGSNSRILENGTGYLRVSSNGTGVFIDTSGGESMIDCLNDGAVKLYYDNSKKLETTSGGCTLTGTLTTTSGINAGSNISMVDDVKVKLGTGDDLQIYHDGSNSYINDTGTGALFLKTNFLAVAGSNGEQILNAQEDAAVELYYNNSKKFETTSAGVTVTGTVSDSKGDVRSIPKLEKTSAYTLIASDAGKAIDITTGGVTVPNSVMSTGDAVTIINNSGSDQTITQGSGVTIYNSADASTGNRTLAGRGMATLYFVATGSCYISGAGLS